MLFSGGDSLRAHRKENMSKLEKLEAEEAAAEELRQAAYAITPEGEIKPEEQEPESPEAGEEAAPITEDEVITDDTAPEPEKPKDENKDDLSFKAKYEVLKGKYDKETPRALKEANQAKAEATRINAELSQWKGHAVKLQERLSKLESDFKAGQISKTDQKIDELVEVYPDIVEVLKEKDAQHKAEIEALRNEFHQGVAAQLEPIRNEQNESREDRFNRIVREQGAEDWDKIDTTEDFHRWLDEKVPYTPYTKLQILQNAALNYRDPMTVAQFFRDYKAEKGSAEKPAQNKFEKFVAPPKSNVGGSPPRVEEQKLLWADYHKFMDLSTRGKFNPKDWGNRDEKTVEKNFDKFILAGKMK
jgi:hypothetical protein